MKYLLEYCKGLIFWHILYTDPQVKTMKAWFQIPFFIPLTPSVFNLYRNWIASSILALEQLWAGAGSELLTSFNDGMG